MGARFGPAGNSDSFFQKGYKKNTDIAAYMAEMGLDVFEYQCGRGVKIKEADAKVIGEMTAARGVSMTLHAPYYISLSSTDEKTRLGSIRYILESARAVAAMGGDRIVVHAGSVSGRPREVCTALARDTLRLARQALVDEALAGVHICPETMGKVGQLGTLDEVMELCLVDDSFVPCIDFGHLNARTRGSIRGRADYEAILDTIGNRLGSDRLRVFHSHFSKIAYSDAGERFHLRFDDAQYGPDFEPLIELIAQKNLSPIIICESDGTQAEDARAMKDYYGALRERAGG